MALVLEALKLEFRGLSDEEPDYEDVGLSDDADNDDDDEGDSEEKIGGKESDTDNLDEDE